MKLKDSIKKYLHISEYCPVCGAEYIFDHERYDLGYGYRWMCPNVHSDVQQK